MYSHQRPPIVSRDIPHSQNHAGLNLSNTDLRDSTLLDRDASKLAVGVDDALGSTNVGLVVRVQLLALDEVEVDGECPRNDEEGEGYDHSMSSADAVSDVAEDGRDNGTARDGSNEEGSTTLRVATKTTEGEGEDGGEDARLEEEDEHEHAETAPVGVCGAAGVDRDGES